MAKEFQVYVRDRQTNYDIYLREQISSFDVYLHDRLIQGDIIIYSIPFRDYVEFINGIEIDCEASAVSKKTLSLLAGIQPMATVSKESIRKFTGADDRLQIVADMNASLCYIITPEENEIGITVAPLDAFYTLFASSENALAITVSTPDTAVTSALDPENMTIESNASIDNAGIGERVYEIVDATLLLLAEAMESIHKFMTPEELLTGVGTEANLSIVRYRYHYDMDDDPLSTYDSMSLSDVDYIEFE